MAAPSKGLGRGLQSLLGAKPTVSASRGDGTLPLSLMQAGSFQPQREIHRQPLEELVASIKANGVIQPIVVRPLPAGSAGAAKYEDEARLWLFARQKLLNGEIPAELIRQRRTDEVIQIIRRVLDGAYV
jgi:hypothetical protein